MTRSRYWNTGVAVVAMSMITTGALVITHQETADAHCQVPCGIYDDGARINRLREDAATIAKAVAKISELSGAHDAQAFNQATRWVATKEHHASHVIEIVAEYFLTQKVKPVEGGGDAYQAYLKTLADHHAVMVAAMKTKQTADAKAVSNLEHAIEGLASHYKK